MSERKAELLMMSVALVWGSSYLLMKVGLGGIGPFSLIALRFIMAFLGVTLIFRRHIRHLTRAVLLKGISVGLLLFMVFTGMVCGVNHTTASNAGFLTSTSVVFVPILQSFLKRKLPEKSIMVSILCVVAGLFLLTAKDGIAADLGAAYCLMGALFYAVYILVLDKVGKNEDIYMLSMVQLGTVAALGILAMICFEKPELPETPVQWAAVVCLGLVCSAYGFVAQPIAQCYTTPEKIGLIFSLEPVFSAILSFLFLGEILGAKGYLGAGLIFAGVVLSKILKEGVHILPKKQSGTAIIAEAEKKQKHVETGCYKGNFS